MDLMTTTEVAGFLGVNRYTIMKWRRDNEGPPYIKVGRQTVRYVRQQVESWLLEQTVRPEEKT